MAAIFDFIQQGILPRPIAGHSNTLLEIGLMLSGITSPTQGPPEL